MIMNITEKQYVTKQELCQMCNISESTAYKLLKSKKLNFEKCCDGLLHYYKIPLAEFNPTRYGYDFDGWYSDPQTKKNRVTEFTFNESGTVYAKWIPNGTAIYKAPVVRNIATADEVLAFGNYIDEKTGVPVTKQWIEQNKRLNELMEIYNDKFRK